ncbi:MAG: MFS transporter [Chromatiales bacterium]|nr:MFS transporter [Chromatiales bacterium]
MDECRPTSGQRLTLRSCCAAHISQDGFTSSIYILLPVLAQTFSLGYGQVGMVRAAHSGAMWLLEIPSGIAAEKFGERRLLVFGLICAAFGYLAISFASGLPGVLLGLTIAGIGAAFQHSLCSSLVSKTFAGGARRRALGMYNSSGDVGKLAFTGAISVALGMGVHWQGITVSYFFIGLLVAGLIGVLLGRAQAGAEAQDASAVRPDNTSAAVPQVGNRDWGVRHKGGFTALTAIVFLDIAVQDGFLIFVAFVMVAKGIPAGFAASAVTLTLVGGVIGKFSCGLLSGRVGIVPALVLIQTMTAIGLIALIYTPSFGALILLPLMGVVLQGSSTITYGAVSELIRSDRQSRGFAAIYSMSNGASIVGPITIGVVGDQFGLEAALWTLACMIATTILLSVFLRKGLAAVAIEQG